MESLQTKLKLVREREIAAANAATAATAGQAHGVVPAASFVTASYSATPQIGVSGRRSRRVPDPSGLAATAHDLRRQRRALEQEVERHGTELRHRATLSRWQRSWAVWTWVIVTARCLGRMCSSVPQGTATTAAPTPASSASPASSRHEHSHGRSGHLVSLRDWLISRDANLLSTLARVCDQTEYSACVWDADCPFV